MAKIKSQTEATEVREFIISTSMKTLGITKRAATLRVNALLESKILSKLSSSNDMLLKIAVDVAMQIPQLGEKE